MRDRLGPDDMHAAARGAAELLAHPSGLAVAVLPIAGAGEAYPDRLASRAVVVKHEFSLLAFLAFKIRSFDRAHFLDPTFYLSQ